jgi:hypothetical protein
LFGPLLNERINRIIELNKEINNSKSKKYPVEKEKTLPLKKEKEKEEKVTKDKVSLERVAVTGMLFF